jgi:hypothetical protein
MAGPTGEVPYGRDMIINQEKYSFGISSNKLGRELEIPLSELPAPTNYRPHTQQMCMNLHLRAGNFV